jgi:small-conductance mechanosensitive channel
MLLRISLGIAILAGAVALYWSYDRVGGKINTLNTDLQTARQNAQQARNAEQEARAAQEEAEQQAQELQVRLDDATNTLVQVQGELETQRQRADDLQNELEQVTAQRNQAQTSLAQWQALGIPVEKIRSTLAQLSEVREQREALQAENEVFARQIRTLKNELAKYNPEYEREVELPAGLKGEVVAVDPKWNFVVLNIGEEQGVLKRGKMMVHRNGKLLAKVEIVEVENDRCIANILPGWQQADIMEGDQAVY